MTIINLTAAAAAVLLLLPALSSAATVVDGARKKTVEYTWKLRPRRASAKDPSLSLDCNLDRLMLLVNDEYPGPAIEANVGDTVVSRTNSSLARSLVWHRLLYLKHFLRAELSSPNKTNNNLITILSSSFSPQRVTVMNESPTDTLALHFHGLTMLGQPYVDGTASVTQCASSPLQTQVYEFEVSNSGTHYWHGREFVLALIFLHSQCKCNS